MNELQQRPPQLHNDILYAISEKLLESIPKGHDEIDFRKQNCYTNFMFLNQMTTWTIITQFAKFKRIRFTKLGEEQIQFYKNDNFDDSQPEEFRGPYIVPPGMLEYLIENGKIRVNTIEIWNFLPDDHSTDINELVEINSLKAFCALFLGKQILIPDGLNNNLMVKKFRVVESSFKSIQNNLKTILAIDAVELEISYYKHIMIDCSQYKSPIIANNTMKITIDSRFNFETSKEEVEKFATNFESFCSFLLRVCPNLNNLQFKILPPFNYFNYINYSIGVFIQNLHFTINSMEAGIKSINIGNEHLQISIELAAYVLSSIYDGLPIQSHDLFKLGTPFNVEFADRYIARSMEFVDVRGRIHKLQFKITAWG